MMGGVGGHCNDDGATFDVALQRNYQTCLKKLADILTLASIEPKVRNMKSKTAAKFNQKRLEEKRLKSTKKQSRRRDFD